ncbi:hypothetical protein BH20ACT16_BH20ACT16_05680 [soil metagenome]|jgi:type II restriction/modification system DNA methylase subunit YeeA
MITWLVGTAGLNLAQMAAEEHQNDANGAFFAEIASDIKQDYETLERLLAEISADKSATKIALAEVGSKMMGAKFTSGEDDELNAFTTLETLSIGVEGKLCMWKALSSVVDSYPPLAHFDVEALIARAQSQREKIETKRLEIAPLALVHTVAV